MSDDTVTIIQIIKGDDNSGARRTGLIDAQRTGQASLVCSGTDNLKTAVGWSMELRSGSTATTSATTSSRDHSSRRASELRHR